MIENIEIYLTYNNVDIYELFSILCKSGLYNELKFISKILDNTTNCILNENVLNNIDIITVLDSKDKENIKAFLSMLGKSDINGQILNCKLYKEIFMKKLNVLESGEQDKCKSVMTLIIGLGLLFMIIII